MTPKSFTELHSFFFLSPHPAKRKQMVNITWHKRIYSRRLSDLAIVKVLSQKQKELRVSWLNRDRNRDYFLRPGNISFHCFTVCFFDRALSIFWAGSKSGLKLIRGSAWNKNLEFFLKDFYSQTEFLEHLRIFRRLCLDDSKLLFFHSIRYMKLENHHHVDR